MRLTPPADRLPIPHPHWIETLNGDAFDLQRPLPEMFDIQEIAHSLSLLCRFTGHIPVHYSVAQHCVHVAGLVPTAYKRAALLHDVEEAYIGDLSAPFKRLLKSHTGILSFYTKLIREAAGKTFSVELVAQRAEVTRADLMMLVAERRDLKPGVVSAQEWGAHLPTLAEVGHIPTVQPWPARMAEIRFLEIFDMTGDP